MARSFVVGFVPYIVMLVGIPFANSTRDVLGLPLLGLWILVWVLLTPVFLAVAHRLLPARIRQEEDE
jgi:hypothetical protein